MNVLVLGSGGREHALVWRLTQDPDVRRLFCVPGNPGTARLAETLRDLDILDPAAVVRGAADRAIDLVVIGPEAPLERGVADACRAAGLAVVGPSARAAALECSKVAAKTFMERSGIPTARFVVARTADQALAAVDGGSFGFPVVVKADGLAGGKGVVIAQDRREAEAAVRAAMVEGRFGTAGATLVIEECLSGPEVSFFVLCDGADAAPLGSAQDHKRIGDGDRGPNTGGMGAFAPSPLWTADLERDVMERVVRPVLDGMRADGGYQGFLYVSLMLTADGPKVIEFNVRFGDPEAQVVLPLLEGPLARVLLSAAKGRVEPAGLCLASSVAVGVVMASEGYPGSVASGRPILGLGEAEAMPDVLVFHAGTAMAPEGLVTAGGRVLTVVGRAPGYAEAIGRAYGAVDAIRFEGAQCRRDIGRKALDATVE